MTATLPPCMKFQPMFVQTDGAVAPLPGGLVKTYAAGTTTPLATYAADGTTPNATTITLDANGACDMRLASGVAYKIDVLTPGGAATSGWPQDNVVGSDYSSLAIQTAIYAALAASAAPAGATLIGDKRTFTGAKAYSLHSYAENRIINVVTDCGAVADWNGTSGTDNYAAFQAGIDALFAAGGGILYVPKGFYKIISCLNLCAGSDNHRRGNTPIKIMGAGMPNCFDTSSWTTYGGSWIVGQTADWMVDACGCQYLTIENIGFRGLGTNASNKGLLFAREATYAQFAHDIRLDKVVVWIDSAPTATILGGIGVANNGAETFLMDHCWIIADTPLAITFNNATDLVILGGAVLESVYGTIGGPTSSTMMSFRQTTFQALTGYATHLQGCVNVDFDTCIWTAVAGNTTNYAIRFVAGGTSSTAHCQDIRITGQVENYPGALRFEDAQTWNIDANLMMPSPSAPYISTGGVVMNGNRFNIHHMFGSTPQALITASAAASLAGGSLTVYTGGSITANTNLTLSGTVLHGQNVDLSGDLGLAAGSHYTAHSTGGTTIKQPAGLAVVPNGANNAIADASPNVPTSHLGADGIVRLAGNLIPNGATTISAGTAAGTIAAAHRPDRECDTTVYVNGSIGYARVLANGQLILGTNVTAGLSANLNGISYKLVNT